MNKGKAFLGRVRESSDETKRIWIAAGTIITVTIITAIWIGVFGGPAAELRIVPGAGSEDRAKSTAALRNFGDFAGSLFRTNDASGPSPDTGGNGSADIPLGDAAGQ